MPQDVVQNLLAAHTVTVEEHGKAREALPGLLDMLADVVCQDVKGRSVEPGPTGFPVSAKIISIDGVPCGGQLLDEQRISAGVLSQPMHERDNGLCLAVRRP